MSTLTLNYPDVCRVRRAPAIEKILILSTLSLISITILLTMISANADINNRAADAENPVVPMPVPVPLPLMTEIQPVPSETPSPSSGLASEISVAPVPVPTPPSPERQPIRRRHAMPTNSLTDLKVIMVRRLLAIGAITILGIAITTGFVWPQTDHAIVPPYIRIMD